MSSAFNKFQPFVNDLASGKFNFASDSLQVALTNTVPTATMHVLTDLTEITYTNLSSRAVTTSSSSQTSGTYKLVIADLTLTSTGGSTGPFQYVVVYDNTATSKNLIGWFDRGSALTLADGDSVVLDFDNTNGLFQLV